MRMRNSYHDDCGCGYSVETGKLVHLCNQHSDPWPKMILPPDVEDTLFNAMLPFIQTYSANRTKNGVKK